MVKKIIKEGDKIIKIHVENTPEDLIFKGTKVAHWVPQNEDLVNKIFFFISHKFA
jgi:hypothetical protein